ncbi:MAG: hypothetical protein AB7P99_06410 [Vicinamibacterales bacterium]
MNFRLTYRGAVARRILIDGPLMADGTRAFSEHVLEVAPGVALPPVSEYVAREVMGDASLAAMFTCEPPLRPLKVDPPAEPDHQAAEPVAPAAEPASQTPDSGRKRRGE